MEPLMTKTIVRVLGLSALLVLVGCYNTNSIKNGGLVCGTGGTCPSGFECRNDGQVGSAGHCWKNGTPTDAGSTSNPDAGPVCTTAPEPGLGPFTNNCSAKQTIPNSTCDPVCQSDCPCYHRCVLDDQTNTSFKCEDSAVAPGTIFVAPLGACSGTSPDLCAPGAVCVPDDRCGDVCYKTCRADQDCASNSRCTGTIPIDNQTVQNLYFCSPPIESCNPTGSAACATARTNFNCVFLAGLTGVGNTDSTVCDCSSFHSVAVGQKCTTSPDNCAPGSVCVNAVCHTGCSLKASGSACPNGGGCSAIYGSQNYGYCR